MHPHKLRGIYGTMMAAIYLTAGGCAGPNVTATRTAADLSGSKWSGQLASRDGLLHGDLTLSPSRDPGILIANLRLCRPGLGAWFSRTLQFKAQVTPAGKLELSGMPEGLRSVQASLSPAKDRLYGAVTDRHDVEAHFSFSRTTR